MDTYSDLASRYDWMHIPNPEREGFFKRLFSERSVKSLLDCSCGTGKDLLFFHSLGLRVEGSDLSPGMLAEASRNINAENVTIPLIEASFCELPQKFHRRFDVVVCLTNSINELLDDTEVIKALKSMREALVEGGILILDQGQTDATITIKPRFATVINNRDYTRFFVVDYDEDLMTVNIFDFIHNGSQIETKESVVRLKVRLMDRWIELLNQAGFTNTTMFGGWDGKAYDRSSSQRMIIVSN